MLCQLGQEIQRIEHVHVFFEILGVRGVKEDSSFERFVADLLQRDGRPGNVLGKVLLSRCVENANTVIDAEPRMPPGEQVLGELVIQELAVNEELDHASSENFDHRMECRERDVEEGSHLIKATFKNQCVEVRIPT